MNDLKFCISVAIILLCLAHSGVNANNYFSSSGMNVENTAQNRANELKQLQATQPVSISTKTIGFPKTMANVPTNVRIENATTGYLPFKDASPYHPIKIQEQEDAYIAKLERQRQYDKQTMTHEQYCKRHYLDDECNPTPEAYAYATTVGYDNPTPYGQPNTQQNNTQPANVQNVTAQLANTNYNQPNNTNTNTNTNTATVSQTIAQYTPHPVNSNTNNNNYSGGSNNTIVGGQCTQPDLWVENGFTIEKTQKHTTRRYFRTDQPFAKSMLNIMLSEGMTCSKELSDKSTITCFGYTQKFNTDIDVSKLTLQSAEDRTYKRYYTDYGIEKLPDSVKGDVMHVAFWRGPAKALATLCKILNVKCPASKNKVTDTMINAAKQYKGDLHLTYWQTTLDEMAQYKSNKPYLPGFKRRINNAINNGCHVQPRTAVPIP